MKAAFNLFDKDGSGRISYEEMKEVVHKASIGLSQSELDEIISTIDKNQDGSIEFTEFAQELSKKYNPRHSNEELEAAFKYFDKG